ncbi:reverse transcriptase domain-containing protein [Tanacetum coccineum]|uniref:Reverse transcriptase domain-containing protein n=1 Tax=Tanacetum coccineum TaxID=301880 RepID=A0ABQ5CZN9_9ASTR
MDDEPMWVAGRVVASTPASVITIPETVNEFSIKGNHLTLVKGNQFDGRTKTDPHKHILEFLRIYDTFKYRDTENEADELRTAFISRFFPPALFNRLLGEIRAFSQHENESLTDAWLCMKEMLRNCHCHNLSKGNIIKIFYHGLNEITQEVLNATADGNSNSDIDKIMARMDAMTVKIDARYKELQSRAKQPTLDLDDDDIPMSREEEAKFMQTFRKTRFYNDCPDRDSNHDNWHLSGRNDYNRDNYRSNTDDKSYDLQRQFNNFMKYQESTNAFVKETFLDLKTQLKKVAKNHQASIQNLETKFDRLADKQSDRPSGSLLSNTQPNPRADLGASINLMAYSLYAKLSLETLKPTKMSVRLADRSFQYPVGIAENMLVEVGKFTFPANFVILEMEEDGKVPLILGRPFLHTADAVIRVKQKQLNLGVGTERMVINIDSAIKHSYSNDDTYFSIDEILKEDFDVLLDEGRKILHSIE